MSLVAAAKIIRSIALLSIISASFYYLNIGHRHLVPTDPHQGAMAVRVEAGGESEPLLPPQQQNPNDLMSSNYNSLMDDWLLQDYAMENQDKESPPGSPRKQTQTTSHDTILHIQAQERSPQGPEDYKRSRMKEKQEGRKEISPQVTNEESEEDGDRKDNTTLYQFLPVLKPSSGAQLADFDLSGYKRKARLTLRRGIQEMRKRARRLSSECNMRPSLMSSGPLHLLWYHNAKSSSRPLLYCPIQHVASEAWTSLFLLHQTDLRHDHTELQPLQPPPYLQFDKKVTNDGHERDKTTQQALLLLPPPEDQRERDTMFRDNLRMIVVRHPISRIIAAYEEKMTRHQADKHLKDLQHQIISKYRVPDSNNNSRLPTFVEFVEYIVDVTEFLHTREDWLTQDRSWRPYWAECNVCAADYNVVVHMETLELDLKFLSKIMHIATLRKQMNIKHGRDLMSSDSTTASSSLGQLEYYLSQLKVKHLHRLRNRYILDFLFFGYNLEGMLDMVQTG